MTGDFSRPLVDSKKHFSKVLFQQGRVVNEADLNDAESIGAYQEETSREDIIGKFGAPWLHPGFGIEPAGPVEYGQFHLTPGHFYLEGMLAECEAVAGVTGPLLNTLLPEPEGEAGDSVEVFLVACEHYVAGVDDSEIVEEALGGVDTSGRTRIDWRLTTTEPVNGKRPQLAASEVKVNLNDDPCEVPISGGYRGLENQLYRVEVHSVTDNKLRVKWSRDNGSILAGINKVEDKTPLPGAELDLSVMGRDATIGFQSANYLELLKDGQASFEGGEIVRDFGVEAETLISLVSDHGSEKWSAFVGDHGIIRRWDGFQEFVMQAAPNTVYKLELKDVKTGKSEGIQIELSGEGFQPGDYWLIPARSRSRSIIWPRNGAAPIPQDARRIRCSHTKIAELVVDSVANGTRLWTTKDKRCVFRPLTNDLRLRYVTGDGQTIRYEQANPSNTLSLDSPLQVQVWGHCGPVAGQSVKFTRSLDAETMEKDADLALQPGGNKSGFFPDPLTQNAQAAETLTVVTDADGIASCIWRPTPATAGLQMATARLLEDGADTDQVVRFGCTALRGVDVRNDAKCPNIQTAISVRGALNRLCHNWTIQYVSGDGQIADAKGEVPNKLAVRLANSDWGHRGQVRFVAVKRDGDVEEPTGNPVDVDTNADGFAAVTWRLEKGKPFELVRAMAITNPVNDVLGGELENSGAMDSPGSKGAVYFLIRAQLTAGEILYSPPPSCAIFNKVGTVSAALDRVCSLQLKTGGFWLKALIFKGQAINCGDEVAVNVLDKLLELHFSEVVKKESFPADSVVVELLLPAPDFDNTWLPYDLRAQLDVEANIATVGFSLLTFKEIRDKVATVKRGSIMVRVTLRGDYITSADRKLPFNARASAPERSAADFLPGGDFVTWFYLKRIAAGPFLSVSLTPNPFLMLPGIVQQLSVKVTRRDPAPQGGAKVNLTTSPSGAIDPIDVIIGAGTKEAEVKVTLKKRAEKITFTAAENVGGIPERGDAVLTFKDFSNNIT